MKNIIEFMGILVGQTPVRPMGRFEAQQPTPDTRGNLDFERFLACC